MQLHRQGDEMKYFSRRGLEHSLSRAFSAMDAVVLRQLLHEECVLDGELLVWDRSR